MLSVKETIYWEMSVSLCCERKLFFILLCNHYCTVVLWILCKYDCIITLWYYTIKKKRKLPLFSLSLSRLFIGRFFLFYFIRLPWSLSNNGEKICMFVHENINVPSIAKQNVGSQIGEFIWLAGAPPYLDEENRCPSPDDKSMSPTDRWRPNGQ